MHTSNPHIYIYTQRTHHSYSSYFGVGSWLESMVESLDDIQWQRRYGDDDCDFVDECGREDKREV